MFLSAFQISLHVSLIILQTVALPTQKLKDWDCCESPVARYLKVITSLSCGVIVKRLQHFFLLIFGPTRESKCSSLSADIRRNLQNEIFVILTSWLARFCTHVPTIHKSITYIYTSKITVDYVS